MKYSIFLVLLGCMISCNEDKVSNSTENEDQGSDSAENNQQPETFTNPLLSSGADPWVIKKDDTYYYTHTTGNRLVLWETDNMEDLNQADPLTIWTPPEGEEYSHQIWAPEIHHINGKWYMYFAASYSDGTPNSMDQNRRMFVLENSSDSPMNKNWEFKGKISDETDHWAIDGTVMKHEGENYFIWSGWRGRDQGENTGRQQLYIARMENPWTLEGSRVMISEPELAWERNGLVNEGPTFWRNPDGEPFLFYSASGCWTDDYAVGVLKLTEGADPLQPESWEKHSRPILEKSESNGIYATGHNSLFKSPDGTEDWILYHANDNSGDGCSGKRKPRMQKVEWDSNGYPQVGLPVRAGEEIVVPSSGD